MPRNPPRPDPAQARAQLDALYTGLASGQIGLADAVRRMRHISGLSQPEFARHRGISVQALRQIETGRGKWILRQLLDRHVPRALVERPKMGFGIPLDDWLRGPLRQWAGDLLAEDRLRREGYLHPQAITRTWNAHLRRQGNFGYRLWSVLMFQAWLADT